MDRESEWLPDFVSDPERRAHEGLVVESLEEAPEALIS